MLRILLILSLIYLIEINAARRRCINSGVLFPDKVFRSPIVVYGESISKRVYLDTNIELLFNITFRVDCILKGQDVENQIYITEAGVKSGHTACQFLEPGQVSVVFVEKWGDNKNGYRPTDFQELNADNVTYELLEKTCHLTHISPLHSTTNKCPQNISMAELCPHDEIDVTIIPKGKYSNNISPNIKSSYFNGGNQFYLQSNVSIPTGGSIMMQTRDHSRNHACSSAMNWILMMIIMIMNL